MIRHGILRSCPLTIYPAQTPTAFTYRLINGVCIHVASLLSEQACRSQSELHASKPTSPSTSPACPSTREARGSSALERSGVWVGRSDGLVHQAGCDDAGYLDRNLRLPGLRRHRQRGQPAQLRRGSQETRKVCRFVLHAPL